jgi:translation initiation factor eIF-2B subunit delta
MAISMGNAIRFLRSKIATLEPDLPEADAKKYLGECIDSFISERIVLADQLIASSCCSKINDGDVILTYARSSVVQKTLLEAHRKGKLFRVVVIDSGPKFEGRHLASVLLGAGIECTYTLINGVSYIMNEVTKVFLGAHGMYSNGTLISRTGTAIVAMMARAHNVPLMVCCETYKFSERVQLDAFVFNELGDPDDLVMVNGERSQELAHWRDVPSLKLLNLVYDVTPPECINMVITEIGMIPCTSVPVVLREYHSQWSV